MLRSTKASSTPGDEPLGIAPESKNPRSEPARGRTARQGKVVNSRFSGKNFSGHNASHFCLSTFSCGGALRFLLLALALITLAPPYSLGGQRRGAAAPVAANESVAWEKFLIKGEPDPTFKFPVAHQHAATGCYGYLYITRDQIWYDVVAPASDRSHGFRLTRATLTDARQWKFMGSTMPEVEFKFANGKTYHFFRVREELIGQPSAESRKLRWDDVLSWEPLAQAAINFDATVRMAEDRQAALAPKPIPTASLAVDPSTVEKGHEVTLTWTSANATSLDLEPGIGPVPSMGSRSVAPTESTTYILAVQGPGGANNTSAHVTVSAPQVPPTIFLMDPSVSAPGQTLDVSKSPLVLHGVVMSSAGIPVVTVNGAPAALRPKSDQAAEFTSDPIVLQPGENQVEVAATNASHAEGKFAFVARFTPPAAPAPPPAAPSHAKGLTKSDILDLLKGAVPSDRVAALVKERGIKFAPSEDDFNEIRAAGGGDDLIDALKQAENPAKQ